MKKERNQKPHLKRVTPKVWRETKEASARINCLAVTASVSANPTQKLPPEEEKPGTSNVLLLTAQGASQIYPAKAERWKEGDQIQKADYQKEE